MCRPASFVKTKNKLYWSKTSDSHEDIIKEFGLADDSNVRGEAKLVRLELFPQNEDYRIPIKDWEFKIDEENSNIPKWFDAEKTEELVRAEAGNWLACKVILPSQSFEKIDCKIIAIYGKVEYICGSVQVKSICGFAQVEYICGSAQVKSICGSAQVGSIDGSAQVESIDGSAQVESIGGSAQVKYIDGSAQVKSIDGSAQIKYICGSAQVKSICGFAQVEYICGSAQVESIDGSAQIKYICDSTQVGSIDGSAQIGKVKGKAVICTYNNLSPDILKSSKAVMIDRSKDTVVCYIGKD